jgi:hypothetical protein
MKPTAQSAAAACSRVPPRYDEIPSRRAIPALLAALTALTVGAVLFLFNPSQHHFYPLCMFYCTTGLLCPGCGGLRAAHQLLHGHLAAAFRFNALFVSSLPFLAWWGFRHIRARLKHQPATIAIRPRWLWCGLAVLVLFGILRNLPFARAFWLAP